MSSHGTDDDGEADPGSIQTDSSPNHSAADRATERNRESVSGCATSPPAAVPTEPAPAPDSNPVKVEAADTGVEHTDEDHDAPPGDAEDGGEDDPESGRTRSSRYRGVCWNKKNKRWQAAINTQGRYIYLGSFHSEERAARAFDLAAIKLRGPRARLNFNCSDYLSEVGCLVEESALDTMVQSVDDDKQDTWKAIRRRRRRKASVITQPVSSNQSTGTQFLAAGTNQLWQGLTGQLGQVPKRLRDATGAADTNDRSSALLLGLAAAANGGFHMPAQQSTQQQVHEVQIQLEGGGSAMLSIGPDGTVLGLPPGQQITLQQLLGLQGEGPAQSLALPRQQAQPPQPPQSSLMHRLHNAHAPAPPYQVSPQPPTRSSQHGSRHSTDGGLMGWLAATSKPAPASQEPPPSSSSFIIPSSMLPQLLSMSHTQAPHQAPAPSLPPPDIAEGASAVSSVEALVPNASGSMQCVIYRTVSAPDRLSCTLVTAEGAPHHLGSYNSLGDAHQACVGAMKLLESVGGPRESDPGSRHGGMDLLQLQQQQVQGGSGRGSHPLSSLPYVLLSQGPEAESMHNHPLMHHQDTRSDRHIRELDELVASAAMSNAGMHPPGHDLLLLAASEGLPASRRSSGMHTATDHHHLLQGTKRPTMEDNEGSHGEGSKRLRLSASPPATADASLGQTGSLASHDETLRALLRQAFMLHSGN